MQRSGFQSALLIQPDNKAESVQGHVPTYLSISTECTCYKDLDSKQWYAIMVCLPSMLPKPATGVFIIMRHAFCWLAFILIPFSTAIQSDSDLAK